MIRSDLTDAETKVWQAAATGTLVDFRVGDPKRDSPERGTRWGAQRKVRAEVIADLLLGGGEVGASPVRGVRVQGARITGELNLEASTLRCPIALLDCSIDSAINLNEATATSVRFSGSHVPGIDARQLLTRDDLGLDKGFYAWGGVELSGAHIGGQLACTRGRFFNANGCALNADRLTVGGSMLCGDGFSATGEVSLLGAHIGGLFNCRGGEFSNFGGRAITADGLTVDGSMFCGKEFAAEGVVRLPGAHIGGQLDCTGGEFSNTIGYALIADGLTVKESMFCGTGFMSSGAVSLVGAHIGGQLDCTGGEFSNTIGYALAADGLTVDKDVTCGEGFSATGVVSFQGAHIGGQLDCMEGHFSNPGGTALNLEQATVNGPLLMRSTMLEGILDLTSAQTSSYHDNPESWPQKLRLDGFVYDTIGGASVKERLEWLRRNESGYSPQIYEQLAAVYHHNGHDGDARRILIEKQRRRFAEGNYASEGFFASKVWRLVSRAGGFLLDWMVGYGYRTWYAMGWVAGLLVLGTILFNYLYSAGDLTAANKATAPPFQPFLYTLDLLLPVASLHQRDGWVAQGAAQWCSAIFIIMGWILASAIVLSLTGLLKRDVK